MEKEAEKKTSFGDKVGMFFIIVFVLIGFAWTFSKIIDVIGWGIEFGRRIERLEDRPVCGYIYQKSSTGTIEDKVVCNKRGPFVSF